MARRVRHNPVNALYLRDPKSGFVYGYNPHMAKEYPNFVVVYRHPDKTFQETPFPGEPVPAIPTGLPAETELKEASKLGVGALTPTVIQPPPAAAFEEMPAVVIRPAAPAAQPLQPPPQPPMPFPNFPTSPSAPAATEANKELGTGAVAETLKNLAS